jgi:hypothetical protein
MRPIKDAESIDAIGKRVDGGIDLVISCDGPLDNSPDTLALLSMKLRNYAEIVSTRAFVEKYGVSQGGQVTIFVSCEYPISESACMLIEEFRREVWKAGLAVKVVKSMSEFLRVNS